MMETLTMQEGEEYLKNGNLTQPFLPYSYVMSKVVKDYNAKIKRGQKTTMLECLCNLILKHIKTGKKEFNDKYRFCRNAKEIWKSKTATGCTDYAILFATFARQIDIPTTILHTAEEGWVKKLQQNQDYNHHYGHSFCECFYNNRWVLVDPTCGKIELNYNPEKLQLSYEVGGNSTFIPYLRCLDLGERQTTKEHNKIMDESCRDLSL